MSFVFYIIRKTVKESKMIKTDVLKCAEKKRKLMGALSFFCALFIVAVVESWFAVIYPGQISVWEKVWAMFAGLLFFLFLMVYLYYFMLYLFAKEDSIEVVKKVYEIDCADPHAKIKRSVVVYGVMLLAVFFISVVVSVMKYGNANYIFPVFNKVAFFIILLDMMVVFVKNIRKKLSKRCGQKYK